jgi:hypothetical protein
VTRGSEFALIHTNTITAAHKTPTIRWFCDNCFQRHGSMKNGKYTQPKMFKQPRAHDGLAAVAGSGVASGAPSTAGYAIGLCPFGMSVDSGVLPGKSFCVISLSQYYVIVLF